MNACPKCGSTVADDRVRVCEQCGCDLTEAGPHSGKSDEPSSHPAALQRSEADVSGSSRNQPSYMCRSTSARASRAREGNPSGSEGVDPKANDVPQGIDRYPVALYVNANQFYMAGRSCVIDLAVENMGGSVIDSARVELSGKLMHASMFRLETGLLSSLVKRTPGKAITRKIPVLVCDLLYVLAGQLWGSVLPGESSHEFVDLQPGERAKKSFQLKEPRTGGDQLIHFRLEVRQGSSTSTYCGETKLFVWDRIEDAKEIKIRADNLLSLGQDSSKFNIGGVINLSLAKMIDSGRLTTATDLEREYKGLEPKWQLLDLEKETGAMHRRRSLVAAAAVLLTLLISTSIWLGITPRDGRRGKNPAPVSQQESTSRPSTPTDKGDQNQAGIPAGNRVSGEIPGQKAEIKEAKPIVTTRSPAIAPEEDQGSVLQRKPGPLTKKSDRIIQPEQTDGEVNEPEEPDVLIRRKSRIKPEDTDGNIIQE